MSVQPNTNRRGHLGETSRDRMEMHENYTESCGEKYKDESGEQWEGGASKQELLGNLFQYLVFHRHFSKSDQGHQQLQPRSLLSVVLSTVVIFSFYSKRRTVLHLWSVHCSVLTY